MDGQQESIGVLIHGSGELRVLRQIKRKEIRSKRSRTSWALGFSGRVDRGEESRRFRNFGIPIERRKEDLGLICTDAYQKAGEAEKRKPRVLKTGEGEKRGD